MDLSQLLNINITRETQAVSQAGFGVALILGPNKTASGVGTYGSLTDVLAEPGITISTDEYKAAAKYFGQTPKPQKLKIGKSLVKVAQVDTITPTAVDSHVYVVTINGTNFSFTAGTGTSAAAIVTGLIALINAGSTGVTASGTNTLILTAQVAGQPFTTSVNADPDLALVHTTANTGVVESLVALQLVDNDWYGLISTFRSDADILQLAAFIETQPKIFGVSGNAAGDIDGASTTDIAYKLKAASYFRTWFEYSGDTVNYPEAGLFGRALPTIPGSETWAFKTIAGQVVDNLSGTAITALKAKNANYYVLVGGRNITLDGKVAGGDYIDIIRLIDAITSDMMTAVFGSLVNNDKVPFTNGGISIVQNDIEGVLKKYQKSGGVAPDDVDSNGNVIKGYVTSFPKVSDVNVNDRANRILSGATFTARLAGAIQALVLNGTVTV